MCRGSRMFRRVGAMKLALCLLVLAGAVKADERTQRYTDNESVTLWANKIGPYENPQETYSYYTLPFCRLNADKWQSKWAGLGEALEGNSLVKSDYGISFKHDVEKALNCAVKLDKRSLDMFQYAVSNHYWFNLVLDELPMWAMVGEVRESKLGNHSGDDEKYIFTHKHFSIAYNGDRIIEVNLTNDNPALLKLNQQLEWTYSVKWHPTSKKFSQRFNRYLDQDFFEHQIHWFSIFNSFMMVIFLVGLVGLILMRTLKSDFHKYSKHLDEEESLGEGQEDTGWKQVQGDVFRFPPYYPLFCGLIGTGIQLILMVYCTTILSIIGTLYIGRGAVSSTAVVVYALSSFAAGYVSGQFYVQSKGNSWIKTMMFTACGYSGFCVLVTMSLNLVAVSYSSLAAIPFGTMVILLLIWLFVSFPLVLFGTIVGRNLARPYQPPSRIALIPRQIPDKRWYLNFSILIPLGGLLPFGSIFIEMYFIFTSFWNYKFYYVYGFILLVFSIMLIVTSCVSIVITYFLLNAEDYRWPWTVFWSSASISGYVFLYAIYFFMAKTKMYGLFQTCFYFGQTLMMCVGLGIICGAIGYLGARVFVWRIFRSVKSD
mmetsp:Transcript_3522/g.12287  ORF Transcript_3522/g.12287 Transcript_3522/m.12287 type:complete len:598 (+) Transcript_3522:93-1886(+)